eukprot:788811-Rhodomonas_salina.5
MRHPVHTAHTVFSSRAINGSLAASMNGGRAAVYGSFASVTGRIGFMYGQHNGSVAVHARVFRSA